MARRGIKMGKIIITKADGISWGEALDCVGRVISWGRISKNGKSYCAMSEFTMSVSLIVLSFVNALSDRFFVLGVGPDDADEIVEEMNKGG